MILSYHIPHFQQKKRIGFPRTYWLKFWSPVTICLCRGLLCETPAAGFHVSKWKILIRNKTIGQTIVTKRHIYDHLPKFNTKNSVWSQSMWNRINGLWKGNHFSKYSQQMLYWGSHLFQILSKALRHQLFSTKPSQ